MLKKLPGGVALALALLPLSAHAAPTAPVNTSPDDVGGARVGTMYTTWDDYYFYAAFRVHDTNVVGTNSGTTAQPQQDDDVEVFFETDDAHAKIRTPQTFQMAVSADEGAYFSVGDNTKIPKGKAVYSYKYAVIVHGTRNKLDDTDEGYDVEMAIPWSEMGRTGPPAPGSTWGFNVISRDRESLADPADSFYSLSPKVRKREDVQNPSRWSRITFAAAGAGLVSTEDKVVCAKVQVGGSFPRINGTIVSGDWPAATRLSFGTEAVKAAAPLTAEEPNTTESPFDNPATKAAISGTPAPQQASAITGTIDGPGGLIIKVVPGGIAHPLGTDVPLPPPPPIKPVKQRKGRPTLVAQTPDVPPDVHVDSASFTLGQLKPPPFIMAIYRMDFNGDGRKGAAQNVWNAAGGTLLADQPMNGAGPWFSGLRAQWHHQQLSDLRRSGVEVALLRTRADDPLLPRELDALVQALKEMKAQGEDYPLIGVDATAGQPDLDVIYAHLPAEFRAMQEAPIRGQSGVLVYDLSLGGADAKSALADGTPISRSFYNSGVASVSPGRLDKNGVVSRLGGRTYDTSWQVAEVSTPDQVVVDSWNDFAHGTEIAASRQYGEQYADATRAQVIGFDGNRPWHAKYLAHTAPRAMYPKTLYQIPVRIENAGTLPWRAGEGYSLNTRWYKDGKLYDASAPPVPVGKDVLPGQALTLSVGVVARDNFGEDLEPGDYTLVVDMVQGQDRWFSYAGDTPLQIPVAIAAGVGASQATFIGTGTPGVGQAGAAIPTTVDVRNDSASSWPTTYALGYKIQTTDPDGGNPKTVGEGSKPLGTDPIVPGQIATVPLSLPLALSGGQPLAPGAYRVHWFVRPDAAGTPVLGDYDEAINVTDRLLGASFVIADLPRTTEAGKTETAHIALHNVGPNTWKKSDLRIGYHWYYLDGVEHEWEGGPIAYLSKDIAPDATDGTIDAEFRAPKQPGRYALVWDVRQGDGPWQSTQPVSISDDSLQALVSVGGKGGTVPVDLTKSFNAVGLGSGVASKSGGFDGHGATLPAEMMPPDGTSEIDTLPLLLGKPGPPLYPSGYYTAQTGADEASNHAVSFLYPSVREGLPNVVSCAGQTLTLPGGKYRAIHLLMAAGSAAPVTTSFTLGYDKDSLPSPISISSWSGAPTSPSATPGYSAPYSYTSAGAKPGTVTLGDYVLRPEQGRKLTSLTLPNDPSVKIVAVTLEKE